MIRFLCIYSFLLLPIIASAQEHKSDTITKKKLKEVTIKSRNYRYRHAELNKKYVIRNEFRTIERFTFDLRDPPEYTDNILDFLNHELPPNWASNTLLACPVEFYIDEVNVSPEFAASRSLSDFAFVKIFQDLHPPCPAVLMYTRKGEDLKRK